ncbi:hypothetical protein D9613_007691 [Agrocybe pediades]|uniref:Nicotinate phosphoribosyltransferase n=1 Tax=Agrocybe pediades TaxID=84607 RepID=A0A8H4VNA1_9AGAR|nr:hypothetical protein D9613_007691 [Agrocybe pediades]
MSASLFNVAVPESILDTDLYKLTMQQAVLHHFPDVHATYRFTNRDIGVLFPRLCSERFRTAVSHFTGLTLTEAELQWLKDTCPYLGEEYLSYLASYRYKPEQVKIKYTPVTEDNLKGTLEIEISGPWVETILWEVPLMACLSETYFQVADIDWNYDHQYGTTISLCAPLYPDGCRGTENAYEKAKILLENGCAFSEFGTRRRRSYEAHDIVLRGLHRASLDVPGPGKLSGTSNVHLARQYHLVPIGTIAHEWFMGVATLKGYENANLMALKLWEEVYGDGNAPLISLTDTFTTDAFIKDFAKDPELAYRWAGLRQDSGDPFTFARRVKDLYQGIGIPISSKSLIFSDSLNVDKCLAIKNHCYELGFRKGKFINVLSDRITPS